VGGVGEISLGMMRSSGVCAKGFVVKGSGQLVHARSS
jgi:hypothetical protein